MVWTSLHLVKNWMNLALRDKERNFENNFEKDRCVIALAEEGFFYAHNNSDTSEKVLAEKFIPYSASNSCFTILDTL